ncbi:MAG: DUF4363 family protein [Clostridia bacterium]|nr:DUF4363 family protein [Clostridia bacterium]
MKAFIGAVTVLALLLAGVVLSSAAGIGRVEEYLEALPTDETPLTEAAEVLKELQERAEDDLSLWNALFPHATADALLSALARTEAAARGGSREEYAIQLAEVRAQLSDMRRDLTPHPSDLW